MENNETLDFLDNTSYLSYKEGIEKIKDYFSRQLPKLKLVKDYCDPHGYWGVIFQDDNIIVCLGSDREFIDYYIKIDEEMIDLGELDERIRLLKKASAKNFSFFIDTIKVNLERIKLLAKNNKY